jgi:tripartite-type tricarboxylate transporter receptor subunit TctC
MTQEIRLMRNLMRGIATALVVLAAAFPAAAAEPYPSQRITLIVPFPPGSATDSVTRHLVESIRATRLLWSKTRPARTATLQRSPS